MKKWAHLFVCIFVLRFKNLHKNNELPFFGGDIERVIFQAQLNASLRIFNNQEYHIDRYFTIDDLDTAIEIVKKKKEEEDDRWLHNYI